MNHKTLIANTVSITLTIIFLPMILITGMVLYISMQLDDWAGNKEN